MHLDILQITEKFANYSLYYRENFYLCHYLLVYNITLQLKLLFLFI